MSTFYFYDLCYKNEYASTWKDEYVFDEPFVSTFEEAERIQIGQNLPCEAIRRYKIDPEDIKMVIYEYPELSLDDTKGIVDAFKMLCDDICYDDPEVYQGNDVWKPKSSETLTKTIKKNLNNKMSTIEYFDVYFEYPNREKVHEMFVATFEEAERIQKKHELPCEAIRRYRITPDVIELLHKKDPKLSVEYEDHEEYEDDVVLAYADSDPEPEIYQGNGVFIPKSSTYRECDMCGAKDETVGFSGCNNPDHQHIQICELCDIDGELYNGWDDECICELCE